MSVFQVKSKIFKIIFIIFASLSLSTFLYEYINNIAFTYFFNPKLEVHRISWNGFLPKTVIASFTGFVLFSATQFYYCSMCVLKYRPNVSSINIDPIPTVDKEWITEIKARKQKGEKLNAYSKEGAAAARRKARALGIEECFVEFLSEEEARERRGW